MPGTLGKLVNANEEALIRDESPVTPDSSPHPPSTTDPTTSPPTTGPTVRQKTTAPTVRQKTTAPPTNPTTTKPPITCTDTGKDTEVGLGHLDHQHGDSNPYFKLPSFLTDLEGCPAALQKWSDTIDGAIQKCITDRQGKDTRFFNPVHYPDPMSDHTCIRWRAFPNNFSNNPKKWKLADVRGNQDEYCEWEVEKDSNGELLSVTFTCELPEYYEFLASIDSNGDRILQLFKELNPKANITHSDIFDGNGKYMRDNKWNTRDKGATAENAGCIAHMVRTNNALGDLVDLVADSTILVKDPDNPAEYITRGQDLLKSMNVSKESPKRNSDPTITARINRAVIEGNHVTAANPIGPYIHSFENERIIYPDSNKVENMWSFQRGSKDYKVRAKFIIPEEWVGKLFEAGTNRKIKYGSQIAQHLWIGVDVVVVNSGDLKAALQGPQTVMAFIEGRHIKPVPLGPAFVDKEIKSEPFGKYLTTTPRPAKTLKDLIATFEDFTWCAFAAEEGIGYRHAAKRKDVKVRLVIVWTPDHPNPPSRRSGSKMASPEGMMDSIFNVPTVTVVLAPPGSDPNNIHSEQSFLQVASFNPDVGWFNWYERERFGKGAGTGQWLYFGNSKDAFTPDTQGLGTFCGHASGGLVMKESEDPWPHWHTDDNPLILPEGHLLLSDELFRSQRTGSWYFAGADFLARIIEAGNRAWYTKRRLLDFGPFRSPNPEAQRVHQWLAHVCMTTTVTIACARGDEDAFMIPSGFFFNSAALSQLVPGVQELEDGISSCSMENYKKACEAVGLVTLNSREAQKDGTFNIAAKGEGLAPWKLIVPAKEDVEGMRQLLATGMLPKRILIALLMVDYWNPVFSSRRARLLHYVPSTLMYSATASSNDRYEFGKDLVDAVALGIETLGLDPENSAEHDFLYWARVEEQEKQVKIELSKYAARVNEQLATLEGVLGYMKITETRRSMFRPPPTSHKPVHPLAEFDLQLPYASKFPHDENWRMKSDGTACKVDPDPSVWHPRNTQAHYVASGCPFSTSF